MMELGKGKLRGAGGRLREVMAGVGITVFPAAILLLMGLLAGCGPAPAVPPVAYLIRVGERTLTPADFEAAWGAWNTAGGGESLDEPNALRAAKTNLLQQLAEQMVLLERAREIGLTVSDTELAAAVAAIRQDYPEDAFEQMLIENAVARPKWEEALRQRLVIDKLIEVDLASRIQISEEEIAARYNAYRAEQAVGQAPAPEPADLHDQLVRQLRRDMTESAYGDWVKDLRQRLPLEINETLLAKVLGVES
jgi:hypothetical protein